MEDDRQDVKSNSTLRRRAFLGTVLGLVGAATVTVFGTEHRWWRREPQLSITVRGPFSNDRDMSLKDYSSSFMEPRSVRVMTAGVSRAIVVLDFMFKGEQNPLRRITVDITLREPAGNVIGTQRMVCEDGRIGAGKPTLFGSTIMTREPENADSACIPLCTLSQIGSVNLLFKPT